MWHACRRRVAAVAMAAVAVREAAAVLASLGAGGDDAVGRSPDAGSLLAAAAAAAPGAGSAATRALDGIDAALEWSAPEGKACPYMLLVTCNLWDIGCSRFPTIFCNHVCRKPCVNAVLQPFHWRHARQVQC